jgi:hypothetical protein
VPNIRRPYMMLADALIAARRPDRLPEVAA